MHFPFHTLHFWLIRVAFLSVGLSIPFDVFGSDAALSPAVLQAKIQAVAADAAKSCVAIYSAPGDSWGSGVIVSDEGHVFTAAHVVSRRGELVDLYRADGGRNVARVLDLDRDLDAALLVILDHDPADRAAAKLSEDAEPESGAPCVALGHPYGYDAARRASLRFGFFSHESGRHDLLTTCRMTAGDSGGPLFSLDGRLIGIHKTVDGGGSGLVAHVPVARLMERFTATADAATVAMVTVSNR
ncbi:MAG: trypsin-like peptidase domain-containing protein [Akkermansiaceae bacterium]|nr:trypsin-like peptidase domain-containing protein [Akkermansiaceae bacterium]MCP5550333.1 trypsin-like peptidase domain-containing protein [Akkermansiaceae bacterium]